MNIFPWFQPIIEIASGRVAGYEALARTRNEKGEVVSAAQIFCDAARSVEERRDLDRHVRRQALARFAAQQDNQFLTVNISPQWIDSLLNLDLLPTLEMLKEAGVSPDRVVIEITELNGDIERIRAFSERYRQEGVKIAFDDFGTGFQQLDRILAFRPDIIKLDMRMFRHGAQEHQRSALLQMVGDMGARLGCKIICEGVETPEEFFLALHCNASYIQGFIFDPALPDFVAEDAKRSQMNGLLNQHLDLAIDETTRRQWHAERLHSELIALRELLVSGGEGGLETHHPDEDVLRFYICNRAGQQISPNYSYDLGIWHADDSVIGNNWSWRPYFYQLVGASDFERRVLRSSPYLDIATGERCYTLSLALDDTRVLLVDVKDRAKSNNRISSLISCHSDLMPALS
ncbi:EAL domain-containing protein [Nitrincola alkalilacustris]|uniref:EAL domain-containing protein n=1 Tax=Nitrincola alkalilacustris TaxID=1571224 RepID=UPI00124DA255|nr:EAL domain-containing protein [Nitrincola alkalilacustris]